MPTRSRRAPAACCGHNRRVRRAPFPISVFVTGTLVLGACGGSTAKTASEPTTVSTASSTSTSTTTVGPLVAFPDCPKQQPTLAPKAGAAPPHLIPIAATRLRVCAYSNTNPAGVGEELDAARVAEIERTGNAFAYPALQNFMCPLIRPDVPTRAMYALFADPQTIAPVLVRDTQCPPYVATNGSAAAFTSKAWFDALLAVAAPKGG